MLKTSLATVQKACNFIKKRLQHRCFPVSIPKVLGTIFLWNNYGGCSRIMFQYQKEFLKRKLVERLPLIQLACFMCKYKSLQELQPPPEHLSFPQSFIITKYLKQKVDDDLSVYMDEHSPCGLSITGDKKIDQCCVINRQ